MIDAAIIAHLLPVHPAIEQIKMIVNSHTSNYERVATAVNLLNVISPDSSLRLSHYLCRYSYLPFSIRNVRLISYGSGSSVFLLDTDNGFDIMKVYRRSLGRTSDGLLALCHEFKKKYTTVSSFYNGQFHLVPPALFLILHGPALSAPAVAMLQSYIPGEKKDLFRDFTDDELVGFLNREPGLQEQFIFFARKTLEVYNQHGLCFDFIGRENLMMARNENGYHLYIIDYGIFNLEELRTKSPMHFNHISGYLDRLGSILKRTSESS